MILFIDTHDELITIALKNNEELKPKLVNMLTQFIQCL